MRNIEIRDLEVQKELDDKAMCILSGGCYPGYLPGIIPFPPYVPCIPTFVGYPCFPGFFPYPVYPYPVLGAGMGPFAGMY